MSLYWKFGLALGVFAAPLKRSCLQVVNMEAAAQSFYAKQAAEWYEIMTAAAYDGDYERWRHAEREYRNYAQAAGIMKQEKENK